VNRILREAREARGLAPQDVVRATGLTPRVVAAIEDGRFDELPAGLYARSFVRAYAAAVGLDPPEVLRDFGPLLPDAPLDLLALAELRRSAATGRWRYLAAAIVDAAILLGIDTATLHVSAAVCGVAPWHLLKAAPGSLLVLSATTTALYFWLLGATVGTAGPRLFAVEILPPVRGAIALRALLARGVAYLTREVALISIAPADLAANVSRRA
jgi:transcriptional regulator with XRE-family HTH domain